MSHSGQRVIYTLCNPLSADRPYRETMVYQLYTTAQDFDVAQAKCYIRMPNFKFKNLSNIILNMQLINH